MPNGINSNKCTKINRLLITSLNCVKRKGAKRKSHFLLGIICHIKSNIMTSIAQQPDERNSLTRTLFVGLAMIESIAIYCFVISMILVFANPFWAYVIKKAGG